MAVDEARTRNPQLGKLMRYHCATTAYSPLLGNTKNINYGYSGTFAIEDGRAVRLDHPPTRAITEGVGNISNKLMKKHLQGVVSGGGPTLHAPSTERIRDSRLIKTNIKQSYN